MESEEICNNADRNRDVIICTKKTFENSLKMIKKQSIPFLNTR